MKPGNRLNDRVFPGLRSQAEKVGESGAAKERVTHAQQVTEQRLTQIEMGQ